MKNRVLSILLITMLLFSVVPAGAFAADGEEFVIEFSSVEDVKPEDGSVAIDVVIAENPGVAGFAFSVEAVSENGDTLTLNADEVTFVEDSGFSMLAGTKIMGDNADMTNLDYVGKIATLVFDVADATPGATYVVEGVATEGDMYDENENDVPFSFVAGTIKIAAAEYAVTVNNGTANVSTAVAGETVTINATVPEGKEFVNWTGDVNFEDANAASTTFVMPENDVTVTANLKDKVVEPQKYAVTVTNGTANVSTAVANATVTITATVPEGKEFVNWTGNVQFANANAATTTFVMPEGAATVTANLKDKVVKPEQPKTYAVDIVYGDGDGSYEVGKTVTIKADAAPEGKTFNKWLVIKGDIKLANAYAAETTFVMPDMDVQVQAQYKTSGGSGGGGGFGGGGGAVVTPADKEDAKQDAAAQKVIVLTIGEKAATVDGKVVVCDVAPLIKDGRTYTPSRFVAEQLGAKVAWDEAKQLVTITEGDTVIELTIGSNVAKVNGKSVEMDAAAFIRDGRTYTPSRFVAEQLGAKVVWNETTRQVTITDTIEVK